MADQSQQEMERQHYLAKLRDLRPIDDDFMRCLFRDNIPLAQYVLRVIMQKPDLVVRRLETQRDLKRLQGGRSLVLDVFATDDQNREYDIEVQRADRGAEPKRARFHSAAMDIEALDANTDFNRLPETYTIFITENDVYQKGLPLYLIERVHLSITDHPLFNDGEHILYVNGAYRGDDDIGRLMHDFSCANPDDMSAGLLRDVSHFYKDNPKGVETMCKAFEEIRLEGERRAKIEAAKRMIDSGKLTFEEIAEFEDLPVETVYELAGQKTA